MKGGNPENMHFADQNQTFFVATTYSCLFLGIASQNFRKTIVKGPVGGKINAGKGSKVASQDVIGMFQSLAKSAETRKAGYAN